MLKTFVILPPESRTDGGPAGLALLLLLAWLVVVTGVAAMLFRRQDLTRE